MVKKHPWKRALFPNLEAQPEEESRLLPRGECKFYRECRLALKKLAQSSDLTTKSRKELYKGLVDGRHTDRLTISQGLLRDEIRERWSWAPASEYLSNSEFSLAYRVAHNAVPLNDVMVKWKRTRHDCPRGCGTEKEDVFHAFVHCPKVQPLWNYVRELIGRITPDQYTPVLDAAYIVDSVFPSWPRKKCFAFLQILAVARMVVWTTRLGERFERTRITDQDLIRYFKHQLKIKIQCDRDRLPRRVFYDRWTDLVSLVVWQGSRSWIRLP